MIGKPAVFHQPVSPSAKPLLTTCLTLSYQDRFGETALMKAAEKSDGLEIAKLLLAAKADPTIQSQDKKYAPVPI